MERKNGEYQIHLNGVKHWVKVDGFENKTTPLVIIHGGPGETIIPLNIQWVLFLLKKERLFITNNVVAEEAKSQYQIQIIRLNSLQRIS